MQVKAKYINTYSQRHHKQLEIEVKLNERATGQDGNVEHENVKLEIVSSSGCSIFTVVSEYVALNW